jgi:hypothetical protein
MTMIGLDISILEKCRKISTYGIWSAFMRTVALLVDTPRVSL